MNSVGIPKDLVIDILRRVGKYGFRELGPYISSGRLGRDVALDTEVLKEVDIDEFIHVSSLANESSLYRTFFVKCLTAGNITAQYVEGLRLAVKIGPSKQSFKLMESSVIDIPYAWFAFGIFSICLGEYEERMIALAKLPSSFSRLSNLLEIAEIVMRSIRHLGLTHAGHYYQTYFFHPTDIPDCVKYDICSQRNVCF